MTYQEALNSISTITDYLTTHPKLTTAETRELILTRELIWTDYLKNKDS